MTASKLIKKLFKLSDKKNAYRPLLRSPPPIIAQILQAPLPQTASRLLALPGKIRNKIYDYAINPSLSTIALHRAPETVLSLPMFAICRQMRSEAISKLCSSKSFSLSGLCTANAFFETIGDGMRDLRFVTIRSETDWRSGSEEMTVGKVTLLDHLELMTSLWSLQLIVGYCPFASEDEHQLENALSVGAQFLYAVKSVVDDERVEVEEESMTREHFLALCDQMGTLQAVSFLEEKLKIEHKERVGKVFRVGKLVSLEGKLEGVTLPLRMPEYLRKTEEHLSRTRYNGRSCHEA